MNRLFRFALCFGSLLAFAVQAQDAPKTDSKPAADAKQETPVKPAPAPGQEPDPKILEGIMGCLAEGLTEDWKKAWFVIREIGREKDGKTRKYEGTFFYATDEADAKGKRLRTCGAEQIVSGVGALNDYLPESQRRWTAATFSFFRDGRFLASYDFTPPKPAAKAKAASKKKQDPAK